MKKVLAIVLSVLMLLGLCACVASNPLKDTTWKMTGMTTEGVTVDEAFLAELGFEGSLTFGDKDVVISLLGEVEETVSYKLDGNNITMTDATGESLTATMDGDTINMEFEGVGALVFTKQ